MNEAQSSGTPLRQTLPRIVPHHPCARVFGGAGQLVATSDWEAGARLAWAGGGGAVCVKDPPRPMCLPVHLAPFHPYPPSYPASITTKIARAHTITNEGGAGRGIAPPPD